jgi:CheY-like chemotaxis protein
LIVRAAVTFTESKQFSEPASQTQNNTAFADAPAEAWPDRDGSPMETSPHRASPMGADRLDWVPAELPLVLLAHSDETRRGGLAWELGAQGCTVVEVEDGLELLDYLDEHGPWLPLPRPDVIVTELEMPGCGGLEAARRLRRSGDDTPIVFINVTQSLSTAVAAARLSSCRVLHGEIEGGVLRAAVEAALRRTA